MKRFSEQLKKKSETVRMSAAERRELHARLVSYMEYHPLPKSVAQTNAEKYLEAEQRFSFLHFNTPHVRGFMTMFAAFVLVIVPVVAERSVPGDILYPVKVHFTEEIRSQLAVSPYAKIELETRLMERRIAEARLLADEGKLTPEVEEGVAAAVKTHSDAAQSEIAVLRESDSDEAAIAEIAFGSALSVQSEVLEGTLKKAADATGVATTEDAPVAALALVVDTARKDVEENQSRQTPSFEKLMARIESESTRAFELFEDIKEVATDVEQRDVERRLSDIERKIDEAVSVHTEGVETNASTTEATPRADIALLRTALGDLQKLISFMTDIDVRENVTVEALVPVTLTDEELAAAITTQMKANVARTEAANDAFLLYEGEKTEKIAAGFAQVETLTSTAESALSEGDLRTAQQAVNEASAYLIDIETLLAGIKVPTDIEPTEEPDKATSTSETEGVGEGEDPEVGIEIDGERATATIETEQVFE